MSSTRRAPRPANGYHVVRDGEWLSKIAMQYGLPNWKVIWNHPENRELSAKRKDPNVLYPGDRLFIPKLQEKQEQGVTKKRHRFRLKRPTKTIKIQLIDEDGEPRAGVPCMLEIDQQECPEVKQTDEEGLIKADISDAAESGYLFVGEDRLEVYEVKLGYLEPIDELDGCQQRLANLGMYDGKIDCKEGPITKHAIIDYQEWENERAGEEVLKVDGILGPMTRGKLKERHGY